MAKVINLNRCMLMFVLIVHLLINEFVEGRTILNSNKAIIKTIEGENGEFIDCFDIYKQPAFDHPLLRNHTIQMRPGSYPNGMKAVNIESNQLIQTWHKYGKCPRGTIPIRRAPKHYSRKLAQKLRYNKNRRFGILADASNRSTHEYATVAAVGNNFNGIEAKINIWKPLVEAKSEYTISQMWIVAGSIENNTINTAEAGWAVFSDLYGDLEPRLFLCWTSDNYQNTGCDNALCPGFVQTSSQVALGSTFPVSLYNRAQSDATFRIFRDQGTGNWWFELDGVQIGYWPSSIYTTLNQGGTKVEWGGEIVNLRSVDGRHTMTQMGSGHFASEGYAKASYFHNLGFVDGNNTLKSPDYVYHQVTNSNCYDILVDPKIDPTNGATFFYGGPGYSDNCP